MATATTRLAVRRQLYDDLKEWGPLPGIVGLGIYFTATVGASTFDTTDDRLNNSHWSVERLRGLYFYNDPAAQDEYRQINSYSLASGTNTVTPYRASMTVGTDKSCEISIVNPQELNRIIADALEYIYTDYTTLLTIPIADHDQAAGNTTSWTAAAGATLAKTAVQANVPPFNYQSLSVTNDSANDYAASAAFLLPTGFRGRLMGVSKRTTGTSILRLQGASASLDSISTDEQSFVYMEKEITVSEDQSCTLRLENDNAAGVSHWGAVGVQPYGRATVTLPSWVDNNHKLKSVAVGHFTEQIAQDVFDARAMTLLPFHDYRYNSTAFGANPHRLELTAGVTGPLFISGSRPHSDIEAMATDAATTTADLHNVTAVCKYLLGMRFPALFPGLAAQWAKTVSAMASLRNTEIERESAVIRRFG